MSTIEDMTLGELSRLVEAAERREEQRLEREFSDYVRKTAGEIHAIVAPPNETDVLHRFGRNGTRPSCVRCRWPEDHPIHRDVGSSWQPTTASPRIFAVKLSPIAND